MPTSYFYASKVTLQVFETRNLSTPNLYKLYAKVPTNHINIAFSIHQPWEQEGFRNRFTTNDHIQVMNQVIQEHREYKQLLCVGFIDYEKAFSKLESQLHL